jgi:hypothetical protein
MNFRTRSGLILKFECQKCQNECEPSKDRYGNFGRVFCNKCGAAYAVHLEPANTLHIDSISFGKKRMPPGVASAQSFRQRFGAFIRNR